MLGVNMVPVFEYYFYPEFAIKSGNIKQGTPSKIQFMGLREMEQERLRSGMEESKSTSSMVRPDDPVPRSLY